MNGKPGSALSGWRGSRFEPDEASVASFEQCSQRCLSDNRCEAFNFFAAGGMCQSIEKPDECDNARAEISVKLQAPQ